MAGRKRAGETAEEVIGSMNGSAVPPTEGWLLRKLAELRRAERYGDQPVEPASSKRAKRGKR